MDERRKKKRYSVFFPFEGTPCAAGNSERLLDISASGVAFSSKENCEKGDIVSLRIFLKKKMFLLRAVVVYTNILQSGEYCVGARFLEIPGEFEKHLEDDIDQIIRLRRHRSLHDREELTLKDASRLYLESL